VGLPGKRKRAKPEKPWQPAPPAYKIHAATAGFAPTVEILLSKSSPLLVSLCPRPFQHERFFKFANIGVTMLRYAARIGLAFVLSQTVRKCHIVLQLTQIACCLQGRAGGGDRALLIRRGSVPVRISTRTRLRSCHEVGWIYTG
jgi:hypothetical protein